LSDVEVVDRDGDALQAPVRGDRLLRALTQDHHRRDTERSRTYR
jgi:hypothetical protein